MGHLPAVLTALPRRSSRRHSPDHTETTPARVLTACTAWADGLVEPNPLGCRGVRDEFMASMQLSFNRLVIALVVAAGFLGSAVLAAFAKGGPHALGINVIALAGFVLSTIVLFRLLWAVVRSGRL